jgi:hypothetical protein
MVAAARAAALNKTAGRAGPKNRVELIAQTLLQ